MAAITNGSTYRESIGSMTLLIVNGTTSTNSDTYTIEAYAPVVATWAQAANGTGLPAPDVTWTPSTGVFALTNGTAQVGTITLFVLMRT